MQSQATTVADYLAELPANRRQIVQAVRRIIVDNLDAELEEGMQYGMIGYYVPHRVYPAGYHCDPKQPLPMAGLASQKNHLSLYLMTCHGDGEHGAWFREAWTAAGKKLDMGKCCVRFKKLEDLSLDLIAEVFRRVTARQYIEHYESSRAAYRVGKTKEPGKAAGAAKQAELPKQAKPAKKAAPAKTAKVAKAAKPTTGKAVKKAKRKTS